MPCLAAGGRGLMGQSVHASTLTRIATPIEQAPYRETVRLAVGESTQVSIYACDFWNWTTLYMEQGAQYRFAASGSWQDAHYTTGPEGMDGGLVHWQASAVTRVHEAPWFALVCAIGDADNPDNEGNPDVMTTFPVGAGVDRYTVAHSGYL